MTRARTAPRTATARPARAAVLELPRTAVLVLGMHRSGTSALAGVLSRLGCDLPATPMPEHASNPKGFYESLEIMRLNDAILASAGSEWNDWQRFNPGWLESPRATEFLPRASEVLANEFGASAMFVLKDPRMCRLLPFWKRALNDAGIRPMAVLIHRNPLDVAASLQARDGIDPQLGQLLWLQHALSAERDSRDLKRVFLSFDGLLDSWASELERVRQALDLRWPRLSSQVGDEIYEFLSPALRHHQKPKRRILDNPLASDWLAQTYSVLENWAHEGEQETDHALLNRMAAELDTAAPSFAPLISRAQAAQRAAEAGKAKVAGLQTQIGERDADIQAREAAAEELKQRIKVAEAEAQSLSQRLVEAEHNLQARIAALTDQTRTQAEELDCLREERNALTAANTAVTDQRQQLESALAQRQAETEELHLRVEFANSEIAKLEADRDAVTARTAVLHRALARRSFRLSVMARRRAELEFDLTSSRDTASALESERDKLAAKLESLTKALDDHLREGEAKDADLTRMTQELGALAQALHVVETELEQQKPQLAKQIASLTESIREKDLYLTEMEEAKRLAEMRVNALETSTSWRLTGPLRRAVEALRKIRRK